VVAIGGLDPGGGAGLARDLVTARALGAVVDLIGTAWTEQSPRGVRGFELRASGGVAAAVGRAVPGAAAVKIGMVGTPELAEVLLGALATFAGPVVFDPVLGASSGGALFRGSPGELLPLVRRATLTTPNLAEAAALTGLPASTETEATAAARWLVAAGAPAVLVKGGHLAGEATDVLVTATGEERFTLPRLPGPSPRGTGCALATALAIELGRRRPLREAVASAKAWLHEQIRAARQVGDEWQLP
jgi:hydroxymethylpyrimidine kinase/phosphomethylpyrimidine kinase